jgi:putative transposase
MKLGIKCRDKLKKLLKESDIICSRRDKKEYYDKFKEKTFIINSKRKQNLIKALHRKNRKIENMIKEMHNQIANYLTTNYSVIYLPPFESQTMVQKMNGKTARIMDRLSFYKFKLQMRSKCEERNCKLIEKEEYYTSKTCTKCGNIKHDLKNERVYKCNKCKTIIERDYVGARNIMLRNNYQNTLNGRYPYCFK